MDSPLVSDRQCENESVSGLIVSLLAWLCLLAGASLFASIALAPKIVENIRLRDLFSVGQLNLISVENQNERLQLVAKAIREDREFVNELTRVEFDAVLSDEEIIPVADDLKLNRNQFKIQEIEAVTPQVWYLPWLSRLAEDRTVRTGILYSSAMIVVASFIGFQPRSFRRVGISEPSQNRTWQLFRNRYMRD